MLRFSKKYAMKFDFGLRSVSKRSLLLFWYLQELMPAHGFEDRK
jgi:hypothetical protein